jgi:hypothetical protein
VKGNIIRLVICFVTENLQKLISLCATFLLFMIYSCGYQFISFYVTKFDNIHIFFLFLDLRSVDLNTEKVSGKYCHHFTFI